MPRLIAVLLLIVLQMPVMAHATRHLQEEGHLDARYERNNLR